MFAERVAELVEGVADGAVAAHGEERGLGGGGEHVHAHAEDGVMPPSTRDVYFSAA